MTTTVSSLEQLLWRGEGDALDFKVAPYRIVRATDDEKSEFAKDVLAMANAWRSEAAFILLGVDETVLPGPGRAIGAVDFPDDAILQELLRAKTNRVLEFSFEVVSFQGKRIGVLRVPCQKRPFFLKKDFGKLKAGVVYVRRGSSTDQADPDEVFRMGAESVEDVSPVFDVQFAGAGDQCPMGPRFLVESMELRTPSDAVLAPFRVTQRGPYDMDVSLNTDYHVELLRYAQVKGLMRPVRLMIANRSGRVARGVRMEFDVDSSRVMVATGLDPSRPSRDRYDSLLRSPIGVLRPQEPDIDVGRVGDRFRVVFYARTVQPKARVVSPRLFVGACNSGVEAILGRVYLDESEPQEVELTFELRAARRVTTLEDLVRAAEADPAVEDEE